jgi:putative transcriptional regulator
MLVRIALKEVRESRGLSQESLAREIGRSLTLVQKYEYNKQKQVNLEVLARMCEVLSCEPGDLIKLVKK